MTVRFLTDMAKLLLPPYRCCGVSTRPSKNRYYANLGHRICDICGWTYKKDGLGRRHKSIKKHDRTEIDK